jgi:hypothetical protein
MASLALEYRERLVDAGRLLPVVTDEGTDDGLACHIERIRVALRAATRTVKGSRLFGTRSRSG